MSGRNREGGTILADLGFRPDAHGFSFENYGNEEVPWNLAPDDMRALFGDAVCTSVIDGACNLTPPPRPGWRWPTGRWARPLLRVLGPEPVALPGTGEPGGSGRGHDT